MNKKLLDLLVCPKSKAPLKYNSKTRELICLESQLAYPVEEGIPVLLIDKARSLSEAELKDAS